MGTARQVMDQLTEAFFAKDYDRGAALYAADAVIETPDAGELKGGDEVAEYMKSFFEAFPDARYESLNEFEVGDTAIDEGMFVGTHTGPLRLPDGQEIAPTGRRVSMRACDFATVQSGRVRSHRFYYDQMELITQLGLVGD